ncbi:MAG: L,D-transpeptidase [Lachnospiraceae bacterium]|nr:L,D-transpeptidase [Lachnospiraceae bacterium]
MRRILTRIACAAAVMAIASAVTVPAMTNAVPGTGILTSIIPSPISYIMINTATEQVIAFDHDNNPLRVAACSTGKSGNTYTGTYKTSNYYDWHLMNGNCYSRYAVRFNQHELMHSVPYYRHSPDSLEYRQFNKLGTPASMGCCRLALADAKWIYENTSPGTVVQVVKDPGILYELTNPIIKIDENNKVTRGWDPTDTDPRSPYNAVVNQLM